MDAHEETHEQGVYTRCYENRAEGLIFYTCLELLELKEKSTILMLGGSPYLWVDLILAGADVVLVHRDPEVLNAAQEQVEGFLYPDGPGSRFRTERREPDEDMSDLVGEASIVVCAGWLHHMQAPRKLLEQLVQAPPSLVVLDTTAEMMVEMITEEMNSSRGYACEEHFICRDAARSVGFDLEEDIDALWRAVPAPPTFFQYRVTCCWCGKNPCYHRGKEYWLASWNKMLPHRVATA